MEHRDLLDQLEIFQKIVKYLDTSGNLSLIKAQSQKYKKTKVQVFMFKLLVDTLQLSEVDAQLGNLLIRQPQTLASIFNQVVYKIVQVLDLLPAAVCLSQIAVVLRLTTLPVFQAINEIDDIRSLSRCSDVGVFCRLRGMVTGLSAVSRYTQSTRYYCPDSDCKGFHGNNFIRVHTAGASEAQTVRRDFRCTYCSSTLVEEKSSRVLSDRLVAEVRAGSIPIQPYQLDRRRVQTIPVYIRDDLTKVVELGGVYDIIGLPRADIQGDNVSLVIEANNVQKVKAEISAVDLLKLIPRNVLQLYKDRKCSPWSFTLTLAYLFAGDITPPGSYINLKLILLLSLMSKLDTKVKPLHVLAVGTESEIISRLLQFGLRFTESVTYLTAGHSLCGYVTPDKYNRAKYFVEGGVLHLARRGVCYVGDVNRLKKSTKQLLHTALSGGKIVTDVGSKFTGGLPHHLEQPLRSRVWAYCDTSATRTTQIASDDLFLPQTTGDLPRSLLESFSFVSFTSNGDFLGTEDVAEAITDMTLTAAMEDTLSSLVPIAADDLQQFLKFAGKLRPRYSKEAEMLIHSFYMSCRKFRSTAGGGTDVPVNADQTILSLAYSHAKLALRSEVTIHDALIAIRIYEEYLTMRFGHSTLCVQPVIHVTAESMEQCLGPNNDQQMKLFHSNLLNYCSLSSGLEE